MKFQLQIGLRVLSKLFQIYIIEGILFKPSLNIVSNCIFFGLLKKKKTLFPEGHINLKMLTLEVVRL